jgi:hypothetical protein
MKQLFNKLKKNNKGDIYFLRVICYLLLVVCIAFMLDVVILLTQNIVTSYEAAFYAEKVAIQGGLLGDSHTLPGPSAKPCTGCLINADFSERISKTFGYFGISADDWDANITDMNNVEHYVHKFGNSTIVRYTFDYMNVGVFNLTTEFKPRFSTFLWGSKTYLIKKSVPFVVEHIPS